MISSMEQKLQNIFDFLTQNGHMIVNMKLHKKLLT